MAGDGDGRWQLSLKEGVNNIRGWLRDALSKSNLSVDHRKKHRANSINHPSTFAYFFCQFILSFIYIDNLSYRYHIKLYHIFDCYITIYIIDVLSDISYWYKIILIWYDNQMIYDNHMIWYDNHMIWYDNHMIWCDVIIIWYDMTIIWYDMTIIWYDNLMIWQWYDMIIIWYHMTITWYDVIIIWYDMTIIWQSMTLNVFNDCHSGYLNLKIYSPIKFCRSHVHDVFQ